MKILAVIFLIIGAICLAFCVRNLVILYGYRKANTKKVNAYLQSTKHEKDVYLSGGKRASGRFYKHWTESVYVYRVDGKPYTIRDSAPGRPSEMTKMTKVVYQVSNPKRAYFAWFCPLERIFAGFCGFGALVAFILAVIGFLA
ncbi:MAG: hypothetical protein J6K63_09565 [Clostridia bacterium]|nr:hypothetical protein [Clostridia bacterium]